MSQQQVDLSELASNMLKWETLKRQLEDVEWEIRDVVLELGKTQTVGNVRATFSNPRKTYDYKSAGALASAPIIEAHTVPKTDWRKVCKEAKLVAPFTLGNGPSVRVKLLD